jgi:hypothetical protein
MHTGTYTKIIQKYKCSIKKFKNYISDYIFFMQITLVNHQIPLNDLISQIIFKKNLPIRWQILISELNKRVDWWKIGSTSTISINAVSRSSEGICSAGIKWIY